ncbi:MAG: hypothetical protein GXO39_05755 [Thermotogae bacterium]|nr:hypothetical protein [Thermotogota bacterium]
MAFSKTNVILNMFKVKRNILPSYAYLYKLKTFLEDERELYREVRRRGGDVYDINERTFLTLNRQYEDNVELIETVPITDINIATKEMLFLLFLKENFKIEKKLKSILNKILKSGSNDEFRWYPLPDVGVKILNDEVYLVINFRFSIQSTRNLWLLADKKTENLRKYIGKRVRYEQGGVFEIVDIISNNEETARIISFLKQKYPVYSNKNFDLEQPIIRVKGYNYSFIPETCFYPYDLMILKRRI